MNPPKYIDVNEIFKLIITAQRMSGKAKYMTWDTIGYVLDRIPAAPNVENVVYCRECKHRIDDADFASGHYCKKRPSNGGKFCEDDDFCSYGEKSDDNDR